MYELDLVRGSPEFLDGGVPSYSQANMSQSFSHSPYGHQAGQQGYAMQQQVPMGNSLYASGGRVQTQHMQVGVPLASLVVHLERLHSRTDGAAHHALFLL